MGICSSCLGGSDENERAPLLTSTHPSYTYNGYAPPSPTTGEFSATHEREYLDRIVAQTSENLIDIFAPPVMISIPPPGSMSLTPGSGSRGEWYRSFLERVPPVAELKLNGLEGIKMHVEKPIVLDASEVGEEERRWLESVIKKGEEAVREVARVKDVGKLVVGLDMD